MFDDYAYKDTSKRIRLRFAQKRDEPMYPWEIAAFLNRLNTVYYKFELLNSICSAINQGISPSDIFIFDKSLPLYQRYVAMNLVSEAFASQNFYSIGLPYPLVPNQEVYSYNLLYQSFRTINSFLYKNHFQPLRTEAIGTAYNVLKTAGLDEAEKYIVGLALNRAEKSIESARKKNEKKQEISEDDLWKALEKYTNRKNQLLEDLSFIQTLSEEYRSDIVVESNRQSRRVTNLLLAFFRYFDRTTRPLICVRVSDDKFRVLGRSLINKKEQTGLELKEAKRNSPFGVVIEGGVAIVQAIRRDAREEELHQLALKKAELEIQQEEEKLRREQLQTKLIQIEITQKLSKFTLDTDIHTIDQLPNSFVKDRIARAYGTERRSANSFLYEHGLNLDEGSIKLIDEKG